MPFGTSRQLSSNNQLSNAGAATSSLAATNNSILAQTLFNPNNQILFENNNHQHSSTLDNYSNKNSVANPQQTHHQPHSATAIQATSEALIVQSNSNVVSDEILQQLHEQIGEGKQIYVLNSEDDDNVQYLIVDKDTDISAILQDPSIFQTVAATSSNNSIATAQHENMLANASDINNHIGNGQYIILQDNAMDHSDSQFLTGVNGGAKLSGQAPVNHHMPLAGNNHHQSQVQINQSNKLNNLNATIASEESIQRVNAPLPKRKTFEFQLDNKKNSYQDAFLKYLAGEKQPTLEVIAEQVARKPKDNYYSYASKAAKIAQQSASNQPLIQNGTTNGSPLANNLLSVTSAATSSSASGPALSFTDKENYYNSSRRENLLPLNNYEYRNSYKDHYDHQGVRLNPAILKALPAEPQTTVAQARVNNASVPVSTSSDLTINGTTASANQLSQQQQAADVNVNANAPKPPINDVSQLLNYPDNDNNGIHMLMDDLAEKDSMAITVRPTANTLMDHTYKTKQQQQQHQSTAATSTSIVAVNEVSNAATPTSATASNSAVESQLKPQQPRKRSKTTESNSGDEESKLKKKSKKGVLADDAKSAMQNGADTTDADHSKVAAIGYNNATAIDTEVTFTPGEFLIHKSTFSDLDNYDIWCVRDDGFLQKYEPVMLSTGERCHQSADVLAQYTPDKNEFMLVKIEEKGKTEQNNLVVCVLPEYEPKNNESLFTNAAAQDDLQQAPETDEQPQVETDKTKMDGEDAMATQILATETDANLEANNLIALDDFNQLKPTFDIFLQILLSQFLNSEFLPRIREIQDDYFKPALDLIDSVIDEKYKVVNEFAKFVESFKLYLDEKPKMDTIALDTNMVAECEALDQADKKSSEFKVKLYGSEYSSETLLPVEPKSNIENLKEFCVCSKAVQLAKSYHSVKHLKINFYEYASQKIELVKNLSIDENAASDILNSCLADCQWLAEMFEKFKKILYEFDAQISQCIEDNQQEAVNPVIDDILKNGLVSPN